MSLEITNDRGSERFRNEVAKAFVEILGPDLQYGRWTVLLQSQRETLSVVITGPGGTSEEFAFTLGAPRGQASAPVAAQLREQWRRARITLSAGR